MAGTASLFCILIFTFLILSVSHYPRPIVELIAQFSRLPGIGVKTAERLALHLAGRSGPELLEFAQRLEALGRQLTVCGRCQSYAETNPCQLCANSRRDSRLLCVVAKPQDLVALERAGEFTGRYWVLGGAVDPLEGVGLEQLHVEQLLRRLDDPPVHEVVLAFNPDVMGEGTMLALKFALQPLVKSRGLRVTKLARGLPLGSDVEYADEVTLAHALKGRRDA